MWLLTHQGGLLCDFAPAVKCNFYSFISHYRPGQLSHYAQPDQGGSSLYNSRWHHKPAGSNVVPRFLSSGVQSIADAFQLKFLAVLVICHKTCPFVSCNRDVWLAFGRLLLYREPGHSIGSEHTNSLTRDPTRPGRNRVNTDPVTRDPFPCSSVVRPLTL